MKVRVKEGQSGFIYGVYREEGKEFTLEAVKGFNGEGKPKSLSISDQFSDVWMEKVDGRKKPKKVETEDLDKD